MAPLFLCVGGAIVSQAGVAPAARWLDRRRLGGATSLDCVPVFTDDVASSNYPVFKGPATL